MILAEILQALSATCAVVAAGCAILAARRASPARAASLALVGRVEAAESRLALHDQRIDSLAAEITNLPTREDIAALKGAIDTTNAISTRTEKAVDRLQQYLMEKNP